MKVKINLIEGEDYYISENGLWIFTEKYHLKRGYCCNPDKSRGCVNCPYRRKSKK